MNPPSDTPRVDAQMESPREATVPIEFARTLERELTLVLLKIEALEAPENERQRKRGDYWLTPEGRAEIRETWDDPNCGAIPLPLLNHLESLERELTAALIKAEGYRLDAKFDPLILEQKSKQLIAKHQECERLRSVLALWDDAYQNAYPPVAREGDPRGKFDAAAEETKKVLTTK